MAPPPPPSVLTLALTVTLVLHQCLPTYSFTFTTSTMRHSKISQRPSCPQQLTDSQRYCALKTCASNRRHRGVVQTGAMVRRRSTSMSASPGDSSSLGWGVIRGIMTSFLCAGSLLAGPGVFRVTDEVATASGLIARPPAACALSDEQVGDCALCPDSFFALLLQCIILWKYISALVLVSILRIRCVDLQYLIDLPSDVQIEARV